MQQDKRINFVLNLECHQKNPEITGGPTHTSNTKPKVSKYNGVSWDKRFKKWRIQIKINGNYKPGGVFVDELQAAKRLNRFCVEYGIAPANPEITEATTNESTNVFTPMTTHQHSENENKRKRPQGNFTE